jgi:site-specific DNA-cytosine methylase
MIGLPIPNGFIDLAKIDFSCPYCGKVYSDSDAYRQIGNGVPVHLAEWVGKELIKYFN